MIIHYLHIRWMLNIHLRQGGYRARIGSKTTQGRSRMRYCNEGDYQVWRSRLSPVIRVLSFLFASNFGTQAVPPPPVLKQLPKIFSHSDKTVRAEGTQLTHALYQFLGPGIESFLSDLKPVQVKELKEAWEVMEKEGKGKGTLKPQRLTRSAAREAAEKAEAADTGDEGGGSAEGDAQGLSFLSLDVYEIANSCLQRNQPSTLAPWRKRWISSPNFQQIYTRTSLPPSGKNARKLWTTF